MEKIIGRMIATAMWAALLLASGGEPVHAENGSAVDPEGGEQMAKPVQFLAMLVGTRPGWPDDMTPEEERIMGEHFAYLRDLTLKKKVILAGPCFGLKRGLIVLQTDSEAEAQAIMDQEPSVVQGVHTYELYPMVVSLLADFQRRDRHVVDPSDRVLRKEISVGASLDSVWDAWTTSDGVRSFFGEDANVELRVGGPYEVYFNMEVPYGQRGAEGCKVLSYLPREMLSFEWNAPPSFGELRNQHTRVVLQFEQIDSGKTRVTFSQVGWGSGEEWDKLYDYFDKAWSSVLTNLQSRFAG
jgi:uncharacterized protein YndB with AHSA1/START domain/uncharacterized protein YciI